METGAASRNTVGCIQYEPGLGRQPVDQCRNIHPRREQCARNDAWILLHLISPPQVKNYELAAEGLHEDGKMLCADFHHSSERPVSLKYFPHACLLFCALARAQFSSPGIDTCIASCSSGTGTSLKLITGSL